MVDHPRPTPTPRMPWYQRSLLAGLLIVSITPSGVVAERRRPQTHSHQSLPERIVDDGPIESTTHLPEKLPASLRDPFQPPRSREDSAVEGDTSHPLLQTDISQLRLTAIIRDQQGSLKGSIETPSGRGFIVTEGTRIGRYEGTVTSISPEGIVIKEPDQPATGRKGGTVELSIRGEREDWQTRHAIRTNSSQKEARPPLLFPRN